MKKKFLIQHKHLHSFFAFDILLVNFSSNDLRRSALNAAT